MKKFRIFIISTSCLLGINGFSQTIYFNNIYNPNATYGCGLNVMTINDKYLITSISEFPVQKSVLITILDSSGVIDTFYNYFEVGKSYYPGGPGSFTKTSNKGFALGGGISTSVWDVGFLLLLDSCFTKKALMIFGDTITPTYTYTSIMQAKEVSDGGYVLVGETDASGQYNTDILLLRTDSQGQKLWQKVFNFKGLDRGWNLIETPDKGFLLGGGGYVAGVNHSYSGLVVKTDSLGNEQWRKTIGSNFNDYYCVVSNSPDGSYITGTSTGIGIITPDESYRRIRLLKLDNQGVAIWDRMYSKQYAISALNNIVVLPNGDIVATGFYYPANSQKTDTWGWILKTNSQGDSLWMREYYYFNGDANANRLYDVKQTPDGGFIACGEVDSLPAVPQSIWVLKLDSFGCLVPGCQNVGMKEVILQDTEQVVIFPNPASTEISIRLPEKFSKNAQQARIFDNLGREVLRLPLTAGEATHTLNIASLPAGIYYIRVIGNGISVVAGKVVKE